jgi:hypothetical protein
MGDELDLVKLIHVIFEMPGSHVMLPVAVVKLFGFLHSMPKYGSLMGMSIGMQSGSVEPHGQFF